MKVCGIEMWSIRVLRTFRLDTSQSRVATCLQTWKCQAIGNSVGSYQVKVRELLTRMLGKNILRPNFSFAIRQTNVWGNAIDCFDESMLASK